MNASVSIHTGWGIRPRSSNYAFKIKERRKSHSLIPSTLYSILQDTIACSGVSVSSQYRHESFFAKPELSKYAPTETPLVEVIHGTRSSSIYIATNFNVFHCRCHILVTREIGGIACTAHPDTVL